MTTLLRAAAALSLLAVVAVTGLGSPPRVPEAAAGAPVSAPSPETPLLAYYYQWFTERSWDRAKTDYPLAGRYNSDDLGVIRQHVAQAQSAGIDGFIVSWKHSEVNDRRLRALMGVAKETDFKIAIIYQGLDFHREPLPVSRVHHDLQLFRDQYADDPVFAIFDKPLVLWSGTWRFTREEMASVTQDLRSSLLMLATEKHPDDYRRVADLFDGDAYYWSSVDPETNPGHAAKLGAMGDAVRESGGLWIAPFAPGFDARLVGGTRIVPRRDGGTLRAEFRAAVASGPSALGLISWNEFSENTHVEPSENYGDVALAELASLTASSPVVSPTAEIDSDASGAGSMTTALAVVVLGSLVLVLAVYTLARRRGHGGLASPPTRGAVPRVRVLLLSGVVVLATVTAVVVVAVRQPAEPAIYSAHFRGPQPVHDENRVKIAAAGDIVCPASAKQRDADPELSGPTKCRMDDTARLVQSSAVDAVLALGDLQYPSGSLADFESAYAASWGRFRSMTFPVPGNHEYGTKNAAGYFGYFGERAGQPERGYYSFDLGEWHLVALNSECKHIGGCGVDDPQARWLRDDLAAHSNACTLAYWHRPRFSSGSHGNDLDNDVLWRILAAARADVVLNGHDHDYERFAPLNADGLRDDEAGMTQYVVGTGGASHYRFHHPEPISQARVAGRHGILRMELLPTHWNWEFVATPSAEVLDSGSASCR